MIATWTVQLSSCNHAVRADCIHHASCMNELTCLADRPVCHNYNLQSGSQSLTVFMYCMCIIICTPTKEGCGKRLCPLFGQCWNLKNSCNYSTHSHVTMLEVEADRLQNAAGLTSLNSTVGGNSYERQQMATVCVSIYLYRLWKVVVT